MKKFILLVGLTLSLCACAGDLATNSETQAPNTSKTDDQGISTLSLHVKGMTCRHCENTIKRQLSRDGVLEVSASHSQESVVVKFDTNKISSSEIKEAITKLGYEIS